MCDRPIYLGRMLPRLVAVCGVAALLACGRPSPAPADRTPPPNQRSAAAEGVRVYVSDETGSAIVAIDAASATVVRRIAVGKRPRGIHLSHDGTLLYVALSGSPIAGPGVDESKLPPPDRAADGIGVVEIASGTLVRKYQSGQDPESFAISKDGRRLFVSNEDAAEMSVLDLGSGTIVQRVKVGEEPEGVTVRPDGRVVYVTCEATSEVVAVDTSTFEVLAAMKTGPRPRAVAFGRDGTPGFVSSENGAAVTVFDPASHKVTASIEIPQIEGAPMPPRPMGLVLSPDGRHLFVSLGRASSVAVVDVATRAVTRTITDVGVRPWGIGVSADGRTLYTANGPSGDVSIIDVESGRIAKRLEVGGSPWGIAVSRPRSDERPRSD